MARCAIGSSSPVAEINEAIAELLERLNQPPFSETRRHTRLAVCRTGSAGAAAAAGGTLRTGRMENAFAPTSTITSRSTATITAFRISWPAELEARFTATTVEIFHRGKRVASHLRSSAAYRHTTIAEHQPKSHQAHLEWTPSRLIHWAESVGRPPHNDRARILETKPHPEMGYRSCLGILRLAKTYSNERLEAASQRALQLQRLLVSKPALDPEALARSPAPARAGQDKSGPRHENVRGADYYDPPNTLLQ